MAPHVDVVAIFGPNFNRIETVEEIAAAVRKGARLKGLICEKPLGRNLAEARKLVAIIKPLGIPTSYFENQIHMKSINAALAQLRPVISAMGPPVLVRSGEEHAGPHNAWFWDPVQQGGGVMADMGCHCLGAGWYALTPPGKPVRFLEPVSIQADISLLKWGQPQWRKLLLDRFGVDYAKTPADDFATGMVTFRNPETGQRVKLQFSTSWMYDKQAMRIAMDAIGPGYAFELTTLDSSLEVFIGDAAAAAGLADSEAAMEKSQATRGLLPVQPNEADLYGYTDENLDALNAFRAGRDALLNWDYGVEIVKLTMAAYLSSERKATIDLTDAKTLADLETYVPLIQQGRGAAVLA
jgi:predicted dehydrogenase